MNAKINNSISIKQEIRLPDLGLLPAGEAVPRREVAKVYDRLAETTTALSAIVEILSGNPNQDLDAGKLYFLLNLQEQAFNTVLADMENLI